MLHCWNDDFQLASTDASNQGKWRDEIQVLPEEAFQCGFREVKKK
jgi:hypothetical protein